ncbi:MAG: hypothetical protein JO246_14575 [Frankiaceae bacterium]|nr:hypothetical protein [Frankiaceae bacterium]MBV9870314.1 hypothetical protein [Frankiaceae bacterium]
MSAERPGRLARIDDRLIPRFAGAIRATARAAGRVGRLTGPVGRGAARWGRRNPTIATALVAVVAAVVLIVITGGDTRHPIAPAPPVASVVLPGNTLGPAQGQEVSTYLSEAEQRRSDLDASQAARVTAIVDLQSYLNASATEQLFTNLPDITVDQVYARSPQPNGRVHAIPLSAGSDLSVVLTSVTTQARDFLTLFHRYVREERTSPSAAVFQQIQANRARAAQARLDVAGVGASVGCVFAVEVTGPPGELRSLSTQPDVRILDPAPSNVSVEDLMVVPLLPEVQSGPVPVLEFAQPY